MRPGEAARRRQRRGRGADAARPPRSNARLQRIKSYRWNTGRLPPDMLDNMTPSEKAFLEEYEELLTDYSTDEDADRHLDLFLDMKPPRDPFVKVLVRKTLGDIDFKFMVRVLCFRARGARAWRADDRAAGDREAGKGLGGDAPAGRGGAPHPRGPARTHRGVR